MMDYTYTGQVMWSQLDLNGHMRHSAYADFAAQARLQVLEALGLTVNVFQELHLGPILFREETTYLREVNANEILTVTCQLLKSRPDGSRWSMRNEIFKEGGIKAAEIIVDGAWINTQQRKLTLLPEHLAAQFRQLPLVPDVQPQANS